VNRGILIGVIAMAAIVVASNVLVQFLYGNWLTYGAFTYPFAFLVTDLMNRVYGLSAARRVVFIGFVVGVISSFIGTQITGEFGPYVTLRVAMASGTAFLLAQLVDVAIFNRLRQGNWWKAPLASTIVGSSLDTAIFFTIAFSAGLSFLEPGNDVAWANGALPLLGSGPVAPYWVSLAFADYGVKLGIALLALVPFRLLVTRISTPVAKKVL
jgi:queuosine precursor transporter